MSGTQCGIRARQRSMNMSRVALIEHASPLGFSGTVTRLSLRPSKPPA